MGQPTFFVQGKIIIDVDMDVTCETEKIAVETVISNLRDRYNIHYSEGVEFDLESGEYAD